MDPHNERTSLEQCEREVVGQEVTDRLLGVLMYTYAVGTTDEGVSPQFADYLIHELMRLMKEVDDYRQYLLTKETKRRRLARLIAARRRLSLLGRRYEGEHRAVGAEIRFLAKEIRHARFPYLRKDF